MNYATLWRESKTKDALHHIAWLAAISIVYGAIFFIPLPPQFKRQGIVVTDELMLVVLLVLVFLTFRISGQGARYIRFGLILIAFTLPLLRLWQTAESTWNIVLGLLPWADATEYYFDANRLIQGGLFSPFSGRRPLFASLLTTVLQLSHQNLQITLILFTIINGLVVFLFVDEVYNEFGAVSAIIALFLSQFFYRPFVGTTLTEQLGYPIGILALIVLIRGVKTYKVWLFALGLMLLTYALMIRAGAFFVLPLLVLFGMLHFAENRRQYLKVTLIMISAMAIPVLSNIWLERAVASPDAVEFANFADTLYGQVRGGVRWTQALIDHPELASMQEPGRSRLLYRLALEEFRNHPLGLVKGSIKAWTDFIYPGRNSSFGFLTVGNERIDFLLQVVAALLFLGGLWLLWKHRKKPFGKFMLLFWVGIFLSIPFLPPIDAGIRPYTATVVLLFLPICFVFSSAVFNRTETVQNENPIIPVGLSSGLALALIFASLIGAPLVEKMTEPAPVQSITCEAGNAPIYFKLTHGSYILVTSENSGQTRVPMVPITDIHKSFDDFPYGDFASIMRKLKKPVLIAATADALTGQGMWIVGPAHLRDSEDKMISACAERVFATYPVMSIRTVEYP